MLLRACRGLSFSVHRRRILLERTVVIITTVVNRHRILLKTSGATFESIGARSESIAADSNLPAPNPSLSASDPSLSAPDPSLPSPDTARGVGRTAAVSGLFTGVPGLGTVTTRAETFLVRRLATFAAAGGPHRGPGRFSQQGVCCLARRHGLLAWPRGQGLQHNAAAGIRRPPSLR